MPFVTSSDALITSSFLLLEKFSKTSLNKLLSSATKRSCLLTIPPHGIELNPKVLEHLERERERER